MWVFGNLGWQAHEEDRGDQRALGLQDLHQKVGSVSAALGVGQELDTV